MPRIKNNKMTIILKTSAWQLKNGKFLPKFQFIEENGPHSIYIPYDFGIDATRGTEEEAFALAKETAIERYGRNAKILFKEDKKKQEKIKG